MGLATYNKKRDFTKTSEPRGKAKRSKTGDSYLIQKHAARRLHYDLRLELDGVLKSWAVTRGPSLVPGEKRLAVQTEDHPLEYGTFEGTIPKGEYGGGTVVLWDRGRWKPVYDAKKGLAKGHLEFEILGEKLHGRWHLVRLKRRAREKKDNWLLIKGEDQYARAEKDPDILKERPESVKTGRLVEDIEGEAPGWSSKTGRIEKEEPEEKEKPAAAAPPKGAKKAPWPGFIEPMLATLKPSPPAGTKWVHEIKFDGYRLQAQLRRGKVKLLTRSGLDWTGKFGKPVLEALAALPAKEAIIDGELVVENEGGASDFSALQAALSAGDGDRQVFWAFDLLYLDGRDLRPLPMEERKAALATLLQGAAAPLRYSEHFTEKGQTVLDHACRLSLEGIVSKDPKAPYRSGRAGEWIKAKCSNRQEFVVAGYVPSSTSPRAIGSLLLGYYDKGKLVHAGRAGTGYTQKAASELFKKLQPLKQAKSPFAKKLAAADARGAVFVKTELVAEIEFRTWTADGLVRHASFQGLREDRDPTTVVRESRQAGAAPAAKKKPPMPEVHLTHPDRIYWKDVGVSKQGLAEYYVEVWPYMESFVVERPLALVRCPDGVGSPCFFQKHAWRGQSKAILLATDPRDPDEPIIAIDSLEGLLGLVQGGVLEIHPWGAKLADIERPDYINMDLDPGPGVAWNDVIAAALELRERFEAFGMTSFVKNSGGKGLHVVAPLKPKADWMQVKAFAKAIADSMAADSPERFVSVISKAKRKGKTLVDYLRNGRGATAVAPYSTRARPGAAVSMPLAWEELSPSIGPAYFTVENAPARLASLEADPWADFWKAAVPLPTKVKKAA